MLIVNYLKVAWRSLMHSKAFSVINIIGLSVGLTCCMLITLYILHETSYDSQHVNGKRLFQVGTVFVSEGVNHRTPNTPGPLAAVLQGAFSQIVATARIKAMNSEDKTLFQYKTSSGENRSIFEDKGMLADDGFFRLFSYHFVEGEAANAMTDPYSIVLSKDIAVSMFGNQPALGKVVHISSSTNGDHDYQVSGVFLPSTTPSHIDGRFFVSMYGGKYGNFLKHTTNLANNNQFYTYLLLKDATDAQVIEREFPAFVDKYEGNDLKRSGFFKKQFLISVRDIHLKGAMEGGYDVTLGGSKAYIYILGSIALFTLLIACINFMNLATARSSKRSSEVGVRKALGAGRSSLVYQFMSEAILMALVAYAVALCLTYALFSGFEALANQEIHLTSGQVWMLGGVFLVLALITGLISGSYPAFYLSSFKPVRIMKGKLTNSLAVVSLRKGLVVFQFFISVVLILASLVIARQMRFVREADLGFDKDRQLVIPLRSTIAQEQFTTLKSLLAKDARIISTGGSAAYPGINNGSDQVLFAEGKTMNDSYDVKLNYTDFDFLRTLGVKRVAGRLFSEQFPSDSVDGIVVNEQTIRDVGYNDASAVGKKLFTTFQGNTYSYRIVGVVKDFHFADLHAAIEPYGVLMSSAFNRFNYMIVHLNAGDPAPVIASLGQVWKQVDPGEPFEYTFLDQQFQKNYDADTRLAEIVGYFTAIAIAISCLGLFGLAAFSAEQRTKEIGIRKVLGASPSSLVALLSKDFLLLVVISIGIASPVAALLMQRWLRDFAYRTTISWTVFAYTALAALLIAFITVSTQAIRAATANPVDSLKSV